MEPFKSKVWLATPTMHGEELAFMQEAFDTNWMSTVGENINVIERELATLVGAKHAVALSSGTASLHLAMKLAGVKAGDKVFCSDVTFSATVNPVLYEKAEPIFIDTEYDTWNMCPKALEQAFTMYPDVRVVVLVHLYGVPAKLDEIEAVCAKYGAVLIEDAAESLGATYKGKQTGAFGFISAISFNGNKIITGSSGGMLFTESLDMANKAKKWSTQSREQALWYQHEEVGYNYRISNVVAGVVRGQIPYLSEHIAKKKAIYARYREGFRGLPVKMNPYDSANSEPNFWLSCMIVDPDAMCKQVRGETDSCYQSEIGKTCPEEILARLAEYNAEGRPIWKPMHSQPIFRMHKFVTKEGDGRGQTNAYIGGGGTDVGMDIFKRGLCLPSDNKMTAEEQDCVIAIVRSCFD